MKRYITHEEINNSLMDCVDLINDTKLKPHIISMYRGSLLLGVQLSNQLKAPLSIIDFQTRDGKSKKPELIKNANIKPDEVLVLIEDIADSGVTLKITEEYLTSWFPKNEIIIYSIVGNQHHPKHWRYSIEHNSQWIEFPWEYIIDTRCKSCVNGERCREDANKIHCNVRDKSFDANYTCKYFKIPYIRGNQ